jgi:hypothetical protein
MKTSDIFKSKYLKADDFDEGPEVFTIEAVTIEKVGEKKEQKLCVAFEETDKLFLVNKTNAEAISKLYGDETDEWPGNRITLGQREVDMKGKPVLAIRVSIKKPAAAAKPEKKAGKKVEPKKVDPADESDDDEGKPTDPW